MITYFLQGCVVCFLTGLNLCLVLLTEITLYPYLASSLRILLLIAVSVNALTVKATSRKIQKASRTRNRNIYKIDIKPGFLTWLCYYYNTPCTFILVIKASSIAYT